MENTEELYQDSLFVHYRGVDDLERHVIEVGFLGVWAFYKLPSGLAVDPSNDFDHYGTLFMVSEKGPQAILLGGEMRKLTPLNPVSAS